MATPDRLFTLLPASYRQLDRGQAADGASPGPLQSLLRIVSEQVNLVEADIDRLYANWFIETCDEWVVPYLADLIGYDAVPEAGRPADGRDREAALKNRFLVPRREVAHTIRYRRRKGSLAVLEQLARDVAGWPARAVEFGTLVGVFQHMDHVRPGRGRSVDVRDTAALELLNTPFDRVARAIDVRHPASPATPGYFNPSNVGVFVTRSRSYPVTGCSPHSVDPVGTFTFSALGNDTQLFVRPCAERDPAHIADPHNLPLPLTRLALDTIDPNGDRRASDDYYGEGRSVVLYADGHAIPAARILPASLDGWVFRPKGNRVALDPELGRIAFAPGTVPKSLRVSYHYGFPADIGGGEYSRTVSHVRSGTFFKEISGTGETHNRLQAAVREWQASPHAHAIVEIADSHVYSESGLHVDLAEGRTLELRARPGARPVVRVVDYEGAARDAIVVQGPGAESAHSHTREHQGSQTRGGHLVLDGLLIAGGGVDVRGAVRRITIRDCLLVPGWDFKVDSASPHLTEPSLRFSQSAPHVSVVRSIVGAISIEPPRQRSEPLTLSIEDSIVDALGEGRDAIADPDALFAHVALTVRRSTILGRVRVHALTTAENAIFGDELLVARRQDGCVRFCYVPPGSKTPARFNCQPDLAIEHRRAQDPAPGALAAAAAHVRPVFASRRYGSRYCQLARDCPVEIRRGADDESEMGVYHDLFEPQREAVLRARLAEYVPVGFDAAVIFVD